MRVLCADRASVNPDDAIGDRKAQPGASGFTIARLGYAIKRLEDSFEIVLGNALSVIANHEQNIRFVIGLKRNIDGSRGLGVTNRIAHDILNGAVHQLRVSPCITMFRSGHDDRDIPLLSFESGVVDDLVAQALSDSRGHFHRYRRCIEPCKGEQPADHLIEAHQVGFHVIEREVAGFALSRQIESDVQSCERRPQFMGNIEDELTLARDEFLDPGGHGVEVSAEGA